MKRFEKYFLVAAYICLCVPLLCQSKDTRDTEDIVFLENEKIRLGFEPGTGRFVQFTDRVNSFEFIEPAAVTGLPWDVRFHSTPASLFRGTRLAPSKFSFSRPDPWTLVLKWADFEGMENLEITAKVTVDSTRALSYWSISLEGIRGNYVTDVVFPKIRGLKDLENEKLVVPTWTGSLISNPREMFAREGMRKWVYPGALSSQVIGLYNSEKSGFYASCNDSLSYTKLFSVKADTINTLAYEMVNHAPYDSTLVSYSFPYEAVIGCFKGDWITVAGMYSEWAVQQKWARESRFKQGLTPSWIENTALWVWNRGTSGNVLTPAVELKERLGLPVNVIWHWWHNCSYDDGFPEYIPPREGKKSFTDAVVSAQKAGVRCHVYMNSFQWGNNTESWKSGKVEPHAVKDINGNLHTHVYNVFTNHALTSMCVGTDFWRDHYASLCDSVVNTYQTNGVYMDQTCLSRMCYDPDHGHQSGGGNYWVENSAKLIRQVRSKNYGDKEPIFTGEGSSENWLPHLDAFLTLEASKERYAGVGNTETIPFFQAVYHQYGISYGSYSSLVSPPYDELWPEEFAPESTEKPLSDLFNKQFLMEQARSFVWGMQPTIANYHTFLASERKEEIEYLLNISRLRYKNLKYLLYGKFLRSPDIESPEEEIDISRLSIYAGRKGNTVTAFKKRVPLLYSGAWKSDDGSLGIALASIAGKPLPADFSVKSGDYGLSQEGDVFVITENGKIHLTDYSDGDIRVHFTVEPGGVYMIEIVPSM